DSTLHIRQVIEDPKATLGAPQKGYAQIGVGTQTLGASFDSGTSSAAYTDYTFDVGSETCKLDAVVPAWYRLSGFKVSANQTDNDAATKQTSLTDLFSVGDEVWVTVYLQPQSADPDYEKPYSLSAVTGTWQVPLITAEVNSFTVAASGAETHTATSSDFTLSLNKAAAERTIMLTGAVTGNKLSNTPGLTNWTPGGADYSWGMPAKDDTTYVVTIPANTIGTITVTAKAKDDDTQTLTVTIYVTSITEYKVDWQSYSTSYAVVKTVTDPEASNAGTDFNHGSTTTPTTSRIWRATVTGSGTTNNSDWTIVSQTGAGAAWHTAQGTTNYLDIPANYNGTITVKVSAEDDAGWDVQFTITVEPRPVVASAGRWLSAADSGDSSSWTEVATYGEYSLIVRNMRLPAVGSYTAAHTFGATTNVNDNDYADSGNKVRGHINTWWSGISTSSSLYTNAVTHNAIDQIGTAFTRVEDGFSIPTGTSAGGADTAFVLSTGEAIAFVAAEYMEQYTTKFVSLAGSPQYTNWELITVAPEGPNEEWLRTPGRPGSSSAGASHLGFSGNVWNWDPGKNCYVRPALWVKSSIFDYSLTYSEGALTLGSADIPDNAYEETEDTDLTINLTRPIKGATARYFTTSIQVPAANWVLDPGTTTATLKQGAFNKTYCVEFPTTTPDGTATLTVGDYVVTFHVTADVPPSSTLKKGETFAADGFEWRVLIGGSESLVISERNVLVARFHGIAGSYPKWENSELRTTMSNFLDTTLPTLKSKAIPTTLMTKDAAYASGNTMWTTTTDSIFCLGIEELFYEGVDSVRIMPTGNIIATTGTATLRTNGDTVIFADKYARNASAASGAYALFCWSRSPSGRNETTFVSGVQSSNSGTYTGSWLTEEGNGVTDSDGVRPALWLDMTP
ncbi:MAG: DUF6273 domain-containing protein, partial [Clostridiales Family XIII bacterium]|nr:DUF6273 domain-containing protein [Clostridiales Family XIII bacterium]